MRYKEGKTTIYTLAEVIAWQEKQKNRPPAPTTLRIGPSPEPSKADCQADCKCGCQCKCHGINQ